MYLSALIFFQEISAAVLPLAIALATRIFFAGCGNFAMLSVFVALQVVHVYVLTPVAVVVAGAVALGAGGFLGIRKRGSHKA